MKDIKRYSSEKKIKILGVEIIEGAKPVNEHPFDGDTLFVLGNEGSGLNQK